jgi:hypothetical protein
MFLSALIGAMVQPRQSTMERLNQIENQLRQTAEDLDAASR